MPALLINIKIDSSEKLELFKVTLADICEFFIEAHVKIRGKHSEECIKYAAEKLKGNVVFYQYLQEKDWVDATLHMLNSVKSRSVFSYYEDHKLVASKSRMREILKEFDHHKLDYLCYSFFQASQLDCSNILPLNVRRFTHFDIFDLDENNLSTLGKISKNYFTYSSISLSSVQYLRALLEEENKRFKFHNKMLSSILVLLFPYPKYRKVFNFANSLLAFLAMRIFLSPIGAPFNVEKAWYEFSSRQRVWKYGILKKELFANFDDDNGAYGESLIKKGLYPFNSQATNSEDMSSVSFEVEVKRDEIYDCTFFTRKGRINKAPYMRVEVLKGQIAVKYVSKTETMNQKEIGYYFTNLKPILIGEKNSKLQITLYDENF